MENSTTSTEVGQLLDTFLNTYKSNPCSKVALRSLHKTFQTHNITVQDWNALLEYLTKTVENVEAITILAKELASYVGESIEDIDSKISSAITTAITPITEEMSILQTSKQNTLVSGENIKTINEMSILGPGNLSLVPQDLSELEECRPKEMSILQQNTLLFYGDNNGTPSKISANSLDYSKVTVCSQNEEDLSKVRDKDFIFTTED